jgi:RhoGAP domain/LIM domain
MSHCCFFVLTSWLCSSSFFPDSRIAIYVEQLRAKTPVGRIVYKVGPLFELNGPRSMACREKFPGIGGELEFTASVQVIEKKIDNKRFSRITADLPSTMRGDQHIDTGPHSVFGGSMVDLMQAQRVYYPNFAVPILFKRLVDAMLENGVATTEGVFRLAPNMRDVEAIRDAIDAGETVSVAGDPPNVHVACSLFKTFLREMEDPLIHDELYVETTTEPYSLDIVQKLSPLHRNVFALIIGFVQALLKPEVVEHTRMDGPNIATLLAPGLMRCPYDDVVALMEASRKEAEFLLFAFENFDPSSMGNFLGTDDVAAGAPRPIPTQPGIDSAPKERPGPGGSARPKGPAPKPVAKSAPKGAPKRAPKPGPRPKAKAPPRAKGPMPKYPGKAGNPKAPGAAAAAPPKKLVTSEQPGFCAACGAMIPAGEPHKAVKERVFHDGCFVCQVCNEPLLSNFVMKGAKGFHKACRE